MKKHNLNKVDLNKAIKAAKELRKLIDLDESILYEVRQIITENRCKECWQKFGPRGICWYCFESGPYD